jgi:hypothetical protein
MRFLEVAETEDVYLAQEDQFVVRKFVRMLPSTGRNPKKYGSMAHSRRRSRAGSKTATKLIARNYTGDVEPFHSRLLHSTEKFRNAVLLDQVQMTSHFGEQLRQTLHSHLREHLVKVRVLGLPASNGSNLIRRRLAQSSTNRTRASPRGPKSAVCYVPYTMVTWKEYICPSSEIANA